MKNKFHISISGFSEEDDSPMFISLDLEATGDTLDEMLNNASYWQIDQDGGERGHIEADDVRAQDYITDFFSKLTNEELVNGKSEIR